MRVLVTGAAGFFGSRAAMHFGEDDVVALDRPDVDRARLTALAPEARFVGCDLDIPGELETTIERLRPDACVHLAWYAVPGKYLSAPQNIDNLWSTLRLARALAACGCRRLVTAGTCFEYDTTFGLLSEVTATNPSSLYAAAKLAVFGTLQAAAPLWGMSHCHLRFFYQYGPWEAPGRLVPAVIGALLRDEQAHATAGEQVRDFLHIDDVGRAIAAATRSTIEGVLNVGSGVPVRVKDVVVEAARACGREHLVRLGALPSRAGDPPFVCAKIDLLRSLGWSPRFSLADGLADTLRWYRGRSVR